MRDEHPEPVNVRILGREYRLRCPASERDALVTAAQRLDAEMRAVRERGQTIGFDRIILMAALNITHEGTAASSAPRASGAFLQATE